MSFGENNISACLIRNATRLSEFTLERCGLIQQGQRGTVSYSRDMPRAWAQSRGHFIPGAGLVDSWLPAATVCLLPFNSTQVWQSRGQGNYGEPRCAVGNYHRGESLNGNPVFLQNPLAD